MNTQVVPFSFDNMTVRVVMIGKTPMFSARDVAVALGYADPSQAYQLHCKSLKKLSSVECTELNWINPNPRGEYVIPKSDILRMVVKSDKPEAERFEVWVFEEVLPTIMETGSYFIPHAKPAANELPIKDAMGWFSSFSAFAKNELGLKDNFAKLSANICTFKMVGVDVLDFFGQTHLIANPKGLTYNPTELGELLNPPRSAKWVNKSIAIAGLQTNENVHWIPTEKAEGLYEWTDTGKRHHDGTAVKQLRWFKGVLDFVIAPEEAAEQTQAA